MKTDPIIMKRFEELEVKAHGVQATKEPYGGNFYKIDSVKYQEWAISVLNLLQRIFGEPSVHFKQFIILHSNFQGFIDTFENCLGVFNAAKDDYLGGYLLNLKSLVSAEVLDNVLEQAEELLKKEYKDSACIAIGVTLETTLKDLCNKIQIPTGKLDKMNADLSKAGIYNLTKQKQITAWADLRNNAAHGNYSSYTKEDVDDFLKGVKRFIADYM